MMTIGALAERAGTSIKTIRYYDEVGVLAPAQRSDSGYRLYDEGALGQLRFVRAAQAVGLSLGEIRQVMALRRQGEAPCRFVLELVERRADELDERIAALGRVRDELRRLAARGRLLDARDCDPDFVCHVVVPAGTAREERRHG